MTLTPLPQGQNSPEPPHASEPIVGLGRFWERLRSNPDTVLLLLAILIGSGAGAGVVLFRTLIQGVHRLMFGQVSGVLSTWGHWTLALIPLIGGLLIGLMRWRVKDFGPGLNALMAMVESGRDIMPLKPISKMVAAAVSLGSGASLGPEGPSVEIGANFSLLLGQVLKVSKERQNLLLAAGVAAGLAAGFNAPIAGVFFAIEVVLRRTSVASSASLVLLAAVVAAWIAQIGLGGSPAFDLPAYEVRSLLELPLYVGLGLLASLVSVLFKQSITFSQSCFQGKVSGLRWLGRIPQPLQPLLGGLCVGAIALQYPQILGVGYETVESILQDVQFPLQLVAMLLLVKLLMTAISSGSGFVGGIFAPALFLGASLGSAYGKLLAIALPMFHAYIASSPAYAMVGMAAVLAGTVQAPLTAILLLFEMTQDYRIVLPLMAAVGLSSWVVDRLQPLQLDSDGEKQAKTDQAPAIEGLGSLRVVDATQAVPLFLDAHRSLKEAARELTVHHYHCALVRDGESLVGILTVQDVIRLLNRVEDGHEPQTLLEKPIHDLCSTELLCAYPDELLTEAIARMSTRGLQQIPVLDKELPHRVVGLLTQESIALAPGLAKIMHQLHSLAPPIQIEELASVVQPLPPTPAILPVQDDDTPVAV